MQGKKNIQSITIFANLLLCCKMYYFLPLQFTCAAYVKVYLIYKHNYLYKYFIYYWGGIVHINFESYRSEIYGQLYYYFSLFWAPCNLFILHEK